MENSKDRATARPWRNGEVGTSAKSPTPLMRAIWAAAVLGSVGMPWTAEAREFRVNQLPNGSVFTCANCHLNPSGGGTRNAFGLAVQAITGTSSRAFWSATLAGGDADGDGAANGVELGDPEGDGTRIAGWKVTNPGSAASKPEPVNQAPQVTVTGPATGASFVAPAVAPVTADATDADGTVAKVEFFSNGRLLGTLTQPPYSLVVDWALGAHSVTAVATDNQGATTTSASVAMTIGLPQAPQMAAPVRSTDSAQLAWTGGGGPFALERAGSAADPWCAVSDVVAAREATVPTLGAAGLFRVADLAVGESVAFSVVLSGGFEVPPVTGTSGSGSGTLRITGNTLWFDIQYAGLTGPATAAHIHGRASVDGTAGVLINLAPFNGGTFGASGTLSGSVILTTEQKAAILSSRTYVNVHTAQNGPGEIRGQVLPAAMSAVLAGVNERPNPVSSDGRGRAYFLLAGDQLVFNISYRDLTGPATAAHIHGASDESATAGVMINLAPFHNGALGTAGNFAGTVTLTPAQLTALAGGKTYVNVHTARNGPGEIRGQILPSVSATPLSASLSGAFERPTPVPGTGAGSATLLLAGDVLLFEAGYSGLSSAPSAAHIHGSAPASGTAGVMINLMPFHGSAEAGRGWFSGSVRLTAEQRAALLAGQTYLNVHTPANGAGEIRGQATPVLFAARLNGANERPNPVTTPGQGSAHGLLAGNLLWFNVTYQGLSGPATAAHIHGAAPATGTAGVMVNLAPFNGGAFGAAGAMAGATTLEANVLSALIEGLTYVNIHTGANGAGEIRGQLVGPTAP